MYAALGEGAAVGIFPEGVSHSEPALAPLKTGAARIALGALALTGRTFPVVPIGLVHREKDVFRSEAQVLVGQPIPWDDLAARGAEDPDAVRTLTERIATGLRKVTVNLDAWADLPLVECVLEIWDAESGADRSAPSRVARLEVITGTLAAIRSDPASRWSDLVREAGDYCRRLQRLRLSPRDLDADVRAVGVLVSWIAGGVTLLLAPAIGLMGLILRERWRGAWDDVRRFFLLRSRVALIAALRERRRSLAAKLRALYQDTATTRT